MSRLLTLILFAAALSVAGQERPKLVNELDKLMAEAERDAAEPVTVRNRQWILVDQNSTARWYYKDWARNGNGDVELWIKVVPLKPQRFAAVVTHPAGRRMMRGFHHFVEYTIFHCDSGRRSTEKMTVYRRNGSVIISDSWLSPTHREVIEPDSVNQGIYEHFCAAIKPE